LTGREESSGSDGQLLSEQSIPDNRKMLEKTMNKSLRVLAVFFALFSLLAAGSYSKRAQAQAPSQYPILDAVANKVIQKYQASTCEQLWVKKNQNNPPSPQEQKILDFLHNDPQMRSVFINKVAAPIANKMFECGLIP
jgi:hypothetical protein